MTDWHELYQRLGEVAFDIPESDDAMGQKARVGAFLAMDALATLSSKEHEPDFEGYDSFGGAFAETDWSAYPMSESGSEPTDDATG